MPLKHFEKYEHLKIDNFTNFSIRESMRSIYNDSDLPVELKNVDYLYHVTTEEYYETDARRNGLKPVKCNMLATDPFPKIYLFTNISDCKDFIYEKKRYFKDESIKYVILKIDIKSMGGPTKIFRDRKEVVREAYYIKDKIPYWSMIFVESL